MTSFFGISWADALLRRLGMMVKVINPNFAKKKLRLHT